MNLPKIAGIALAVVLIAGGTAAALPGNAPADAPVPDQANTNETVTDAADANETDESADRADRRPHEATERGPPAERGPHMSENASAAERGPPTDMPEQVPDFVTELHETINQFLSGELEGDLGAAIADVTPEDADDVPDDENSADDEQSADDRELDEQAERASDSDDETPEDDMEDDEAADDEMNDEETDDESTDSDDDTTVES
ncbi:hypothetical protein [Halapricum desulfuricans]|uniref:hypothetical protein n=1 Tax=Halapricum desulfuricans TaxID=2841257 RepID=UPI001E4E1BFE|nr:hypothetical protein [Halapricum desulfuricans]